MTYDQLLQKAQDHLFLDERGEAVATYGAALGVEPNGKEALRQLALLANEMGDVQGAVGFFDRLATIDESDAFARFNLGLILFEHGHLSEAHHYIGNAVALVDQYLDAAREQKNLEVETAHTAEQFASIAGDARVLLSEIETLQEAA